MQIYRAHSISHFPDEEVPKFSDLSSAVKLTQILPIILSMHRLQ